VSPFSAADRAVCERGEDRHLLRDVALANSEPSMHYTHLCPPPETVQDSALSSIHCYSSLRNVSDPWYPVIRSSAALYTPPRPRVGSASHSPQLFMRMKSDAKVIRSSDDFQLPSSNATRGRLSQFKPRALVRWFNHLHLRAVSPSNLYCPCLVWAHRHVQER